MHLNVLFQLCIRNAHVQRQNVFLAFDAEFTFQTCKAKIRDILNLEFIVFKQLVPYAELKHPLLLKGIDNPKAINAGSQHLLVT